ncbi:Protease prsW family protein [Candidatus Anstonella stagnisolia]|nr:Protease prsW family protein [Candidatus Anstonella stagnisolia]
MERNKLALLFLFILAAHVFSQVSYGDPFTVGLDTKIVVESKPLEKPHESVLVLATLENTYPSEQTISLMRETDDGGWERVKTIGVLEPGKKANATITIALDYDLQTTKKTRYALVASGLEGTKGKYFEVFEDWSGYEDLIRKDLANATFFAAPLIAIVLTAVVLLLMRVASTAHPREAYAGEYNTKSLFMPKIAGLSFGEKLADFYMMPTAWVLEALGLFVLVFIMYTTLAPAIKNSEGLMQIMALSGLGAAAMPVIYFAAAWLYSERNEKKPLRLFAAMFFWGIFAAVLSLGFNTFQTGLLKGRVDESLMLLLGVAVIAPVVEETIKCAGLVLVSAHHEFDDELTGMMLGFSIGLGFSFVENWFYFASKTNPLETGFLAWASVILYRSFFNSLAHGCFTATAGGIVGYVKSHKNLSAYTRIAIVPAVLAAIALHMIFNLSALLDGFMIASQRITIFIFNPVLVVILGAAFIIAILFAELDRSRMRARAAAKSAAAAGKS